MRPEDCLAPSYREYGAMLWRGVQMHEILLYWGGDERGSDFAGPKHDFPFCVPIATQCLHAAGAAMAYKLRGEPRCAVSVNRRRRHLRRRVLRGAERAAGARPAGGVRGHQQQVGHLGAAGTADRLAHAGAEGVAAGIPGLQVDGNDVIAVRHWVERALERGRRGEGPTC
jgi:2-oxoisovalerate dehydrogenase E1 component alpha subunit